MDPPTASHPLKVRRDFRPPLPGCRTLPQCDAPARFHCDAIRAGPVAFAEPAARALSALPHLSGRVGGGLYGLGAAPDWVLVGSQSRTRASVCRKQRPHAPCFKRLCDLTTSRRTCDYAPQPRLPNFEREQHEDAMRRSEWGDVEPYL